MNFSTEMFEVDIENEEFDYILEQVTKYGKSDLVNKDELEELDEDEMEYTQDMDDGSQTKVRWNIFCN
jgi:hypothetical protein